MLLDSVWDALSTVYGLRPASIREGEFSVNGEFDKMFTVLFDSGALHHSYINKEIVDRHRESWKSMIKPFAARVRLADQKTVVHTTEMVTGVLSFMGDDGVQHEGMVDAIVFNMKGLDFIVGLPDIVRNFITIFFTMLQQYKEDEVYGLVSRPESVAMQPGEIRQWSYEQDEEAPEEKECPIPVEHEPFLQFMETSYDEALKEYFDMLGDHVGEHLKDCKEFWEILKSELAHARFVPKEWEGIKGFEPLELVWKENFPESHPVRARPINPKLWDVAYKEYVRLCEYMYERSKSPYASPLVTAAKNTKPFIRFCGDYTWLNPYLVVAQAYIPRVQYEIEKAASFSIMLDMDCTNAYHQRRLGPISSERLAIQTPWGLVQPRFMPEGISPASAELQSMMSTIFREFEPWTIVIFDNILVLAHDQKDACNKMRLFLKKCEEYNVQLKMAKSWFVFSSVKFFGYKVSKGKYEMDEDRKRTIMDFEMPNSQKSMMRFLGAAVFFKSFVANYSDVAATLHKMTHKDFNWDRKTWTQDYVQAFDKMKQALINSIALFFPDYALPWILRVDASDVAVGAVLYQIRTDKDGKDANEPIGFASKKFSETAMKWDAFKKEAYAAFFGVNYYAYYLRGKAFILETDHRNLQWIEKSEVPMVVRWRVFLQSFCIHIRHIPGTKNLVADWISRMVAALFGMSVEEFMERNGDDADISCFMSMIIHSEEELLSSSVAPEPEDYIEQEGMFRHAECTPDFVDALEELWVSRQSGIFQRAADGEVSEILKDSLAAMPVVDAPERLEQLPDAVGDKVLIEFAEVPQEGVIEGHSSIADEVEQRVPFTPQPIVNVPMEDAPVIPAPVAPGVQLRHWTHEEMFADVHGGRKMHWGARRTWLALNKRFPGHKIPYRWLEEMIMKCRTCQKYRTSFGDYVEPIYSHLKPAHPRARVGFDGLTVTPPDKYGNTHLIVVVDFYTKYVWAHVASNYEAESIATALFIYYCTFGVFDEVWTDSGSNICSEVVEQLNQWLQVKHVKALTDRHQTNGTEGSNKQIIRHLRTITHDFRIVNRWSDPIILCLVLFVINDQVNSETGVRPLDAKFGSRDGPYLKLPTDALPETITNAWVVALDEDLRAIRKISTEYQQMLIEERTRSTPLETQNTFQPGDLVLWERDRTKPRPTKLSAPNHGPWEVIKQEHNIVLCRHVISEKVEPLHVTRLRLFSGTIEEAKDVALRDDDQYMVVAITAWKGSPDVRSNMQFWVEYDDGDAMWVTYKPDLASNDKFKAYVDRTSELFPLRFSTTDL